MKGPTPKTVVHCRSCGRLFFVVPTAHDRGRVLQVIEIPK